MESFAGQAEHYQGWSNVIADFTAVALMACSLWQWEAPWHHQALMSLQGVGMFAELFAADSCAEMDCQQLPENCFPDQFSLCMLLIKFYLLRMRKKAPPPSLSV